MQESPLELGPPLTGSAPSAPHARASGMERRSLELTSAGVALALVVMNVVHHVNAERWFESLWLCNVSLATTALALALRSPLLGTASFVWLIPGTLAWAIEASLLGTRFAITSYFIHLGGAPLAAFAVRALGVHEQGRAAALALLSALVLLARLLPPGANVNCAFGPREAWFLLPQQPLAHALSLVLLALATSALSLRLARWLAAHRPR